MSQVTPRNLIARQRPAGAPRVTITMPAFNYACFMGESIRSVLAQTFTDFELIVVDDGSSDNTESVVRNFNDPRIRYIYQEHQGVSVAENTGLRAARGEYLTGIGADDLYLPENLGTKVAYLDAHPEAGVVTSDAFVFNHETGANIGRFWRDDPTHGWVDPGAIGPYPLQELIVHGCFIAPQASMIRRTVFEAVGSFDESLPTCEDWDLLIRIVEKFRIQILDLPLLRLRRHDSNMSKNQDEMYCGEVTVMQRLLANGRVAPEIRRLVKNRLRALHMSYGRRALREGRTGPARKAFLSSIIIDPRRAKVYWQFARTLLGTGKYRAFMSSRLYPKQKAVARSLENGTRNETV